MPNLIVQESLSAQTVLLSSGRETLLLSKQALQLLTMEACAVICGRYEIEVFDQCAGPSSGRAGELSRALLCGNFDVAATTVAAYAIRKQWPRARILILGDVAVEFADYLYDDSLQANCTAAMLLGALSAESGDLLLRGPSWSSVVKDPVTAPAESDPAKAEVSGLAKARREPWDLPADEREQSSGRFTKLAGTPLSGRTQPGLRRQGVGMVSARGSSYPPCRQSGRR